MNENLRLCLPSASQGSNSFPFLSLFGILLTLWILLVISPNSQAMGQDAVPIHGLRVLFVGGQSDPVSIPQAYGAGSRVKPRTVALFRERTAAYEALLRYHFAKVQVVHGVDYNPKLSERFDVTIFDTVPSPIVASQVIDDVVSPASQGQRPRFVPSRFSKPALMIAQNTSLIGEPLGLKLDCL